MIIQTPHPLSILTKQSSSQLNISLNSMDNTTEIRPVVNNDQWIMDCDTPCLINDNNCNKQPQLKPNSSAHVNSQMTSGHIYSR